MTDDDNIPETTEGEMPGDNVLKNEKALGAEALKTMRAVEKLFTKHDRMIEKIHPGVVEFGRKLQIGRELYEYDNNGFSEWVTRSKLDTGRIFGRQQERTAAMTIYRLVVHGEGTGEEGAVPQKLDLTNCKRARPTDIIDWARKDQPDLFEDLRRKKQAAKLKKEKTAEPGGGGDDALDDDIGDLSCGTREGTGRAADEDQRISDVKAENARLRDRVAKLEAENKNLRAQLGNNRLTWRESATEKGCFHSSDIDIGFFVIEQQPSGYEVFYCEPNSKDDLKVATVNTLDEAKAIAQTYADEEAVR